jgi:recombination protein RecT
MSKDQMAVSQKPKFSVAIQTDMYKKLINSTLQDPKRANRFIAAISSAVAVNPALQECDAGTILSSAFLGESLNLSPSPQLGQYYLVPFNDTKNDRKIATFILGYKGYIQLAIRSGYYKKMNVIAIKEGELKAIDILNEEIQVVLIEDYEAREKAKTVGYYAMFEYLNGFRKTIYWSREKMMSHADKYSPAFSKDSKTMTIKGQKKVKVSFDDYEAGKFSKDDAWLYSSFWYKDFDEMAFKTMLRQLISKWGIMSIDMQDAFENDMAVVNQDGTKEYVDNQEDLPDLEPITDTPTEIVKEAAPGGQQTISMNELG